MNLITDGLLMATAMIAGIYCLVLSRRLRRLTDSSSGIGSQIAALDRALAETRGALTETREGVSEMRASARAAIAELKRRTGSAEEAAGALAEATGKAETALQRLYEAHERVEALERPEADPAADPPRAEQQDDAGTPRRPIVLDVDGGAERLGPSRSRVRAGEASDTDGAPADAASGSPEEEPRLGKRKGGGLGG